MLTIVTGTPGAGKTLFSLHRLKKDFRDGVDEADKRPIYVNGVPEIDYAAFEAEPLENPEKWYECPEGSIIFIDEGQRIFPQRPASAAVPTKCREFETHRHKGFDVIVTTQDANTLDVHLRRLAGRHFHIHRTLGQELAAVIEYDHYQKDPRDFLNKKDAISQSSWKYDKKLYGLYKSAEVHTVKKRYPWKLFMIPLAILFIIGMGFLAIKTLTGEMDKMSGEQEQDIQSPQYRADPFGADPIKVNHYDIHQPKIPGLLHTAPFYSEAFTAETFPKPFCITYQVEKDGPLNAACKCLTQQATTYATDDKTCRYWAKHGFFDPTLSEDTENTAGDAYAERGAPAGLSGRYDYQNPRVGVVNDRMRAAAAKRQLQGSYTD